MSTKGSSGIRTAGYGQGLEKYLCNSSSVLLPLAAGNAVEAGLVRCCAAYAVLHFSSNCCKSPVSLQTVHMQRVRRSYQSVPSSANIEKLTMPARLIQEHC